MLQPVSAIVGLILIVSGCGLGLWSNYVQFTVGRGTPVPLMATRKLIVQPPYACCRNPMAAGAIALYLGVSVAAGSPGAGLLWLLGAVTLVAYIRLVEEQEMIARFGDEYLAYRRRVPFIIPRLRSQ